MGDETQGGWIGSTVRRKGRVVLGIGILTRRHRKTYTSHTSYHSETVYQMGFGMVGYPNLHKKSTLFWDSLYFSPHSLIYG